MRKSGPESGSKRVLPAFIETIKTVLGAKWNIDRIHLYFLSFLVFTMQNATKTKTASPQGIFFLSCVMTEPVSIYVISTVVPSPIQQCVALCSVKFSSVAFRGSYC